MARYSQRPENALKRANEFIDVGKPSRALETLYEVFRNKKWAYTWSESLLEPIMFKYLDLCVELKKSIIAKEGLFQYRNMFQSVNVGSLENVIRGYLRMAEEKTESAREKSQQAVIDIDDLDNLATPESILLSAVSGEDAQDRSDRTILTPWVKFLWESYCQCLELLRTNAHCETLYHDIARMAFSFCLKYNRKTEFRKLCDKLRKHLEDISKLPIQTANVSLTKPETQQYNLETRLFQLDSAIQMELWQEAYKAIEDIHGLMNMSKKPPISKTMANYYQKLAMVFWKAGYYLFHAAALFKLFQLSKDMRKNITHDELQRMACCVLLATLSIPLPSAHPEFDRFIETDKSPLEKAQRLATLLTLQQPPTRASLIRDLVRMNVVQRASPELQELYQALEVDFNPLTLCKRVYAVTSQLQGDEQYIPPLQDVTLVKLIRQVSQVYQTINFKRLLELSMFTTPFHLERLLVDCVRHNDMQIRIDHGSGCVHFGLDLSESPRETAQDGPILQSMPSDQLRTQLINMANVLNEALHIINPNINRGSKDEVRTQLVRHYKEHMYKDHQRILERHKIIEDRKEYLEKLNTVREEEEQRRAEELARQQAQIEERRLQQEREERERKRQENEIQQIKDRNLKEKMQQISQTAHGQKMLRKLDEEEIKKLDAEQIALKEAEELQKEKREMQQKLKSQEKKIDYYERAKRLEEIPLLQKSFAERQVEEKNLWEEQERRKIAELVLERERAVETRKRLARMAEDRQEFLSKLKSGRDSEYQVKMKEYEKLLAEEKAKRLAERKAARYAERKAAWIEEKKRRAEEEEKQRLEEERKKKEEEEALRKAEKAEEERKKMEVLNRQAEIQRKREEEAAKSQMEKEKQLLAKSSAADKGIWRPKALRDRDGTSGERGDRGERNERAPASESWRKGGQPDKDDDRDDRDREKSAFAPRRDEDRGSWRRGGGADDDRGFSRRDDDRPRRDDDRPRRDDDRPRRDDDRPRRDVDRPPRRDDERGPRRDDDRAIRRDDGDRPTRREDMDRPRRDDGDRPSRREDDSYFQRKMPPGRRDERFSNRSGFGERDRPRDSGPPSSGSWRSGPGPQESEKEPEREPPRRPPPASTEEKKEWRKDPPKPAPAPERSAGNNEEDGDDNTWKTVGRR
ncbi:Eukaryotic translation initiation factor 3 subunit F-1 [Nesidiocoris tenuis]|uniref:Eukaryotic translation initiation factor 3 subunit A n=2 Tax=Miridae TaxID=30083 RepID=A0ABN7AX84_9HEMI|nr:Eukaryotic translation initiation factor 3 subunit F-1 [Nesidiocoris tenuis]